MQYYTYMGKTVFCERWNLKIPLRGKYVYTDNPENPYEARFAFALCPLAENCKIPERKQTGEFRHMWCHHRQECELLNDFPSTVDTRNQKL